MWWWHLGVGEGHFPAVTQDLELLRGPPMAIEQLTEDIGSNLTESTKMMDQKPKVPRARYQNHVRLKHARTRMCPAVRISYQCPRLDV